MVSTVVTRSSTAWWGNEGGKGTDLFNLEDLGLELFVLLAVLDVVCELRRSARAVSDGVMNRQQDAPLWVATMPVYDFCLGAEGIGSSDEDF